MSSQKKEPTIREDFIEYLCRFWFYRKPGKWGTSTFKLNKNEPDDLGNDTWLSLSDSEKDTVSIREWNDNNHRWLHLVSIDNELRRQSFPMAVPYSKNMSKTEQREKIEILVSQVPDEYFRNYVLLRRKSRKFIQDQQREKKRTQDVQIVGEQTLDERLEKGAGTAIDLTGDKHCQYIQYIPNMFKNI